MAFMLRLCRSHGAGPPPPGVFRLLRVALSTVEGTSASLPLGFLEEIASGIDGYEGPVALEAPPQEAFQGLRQAIEALLAVPPAAVRAERGDLKPKLGAQGHFS